MPKSILYKIALFTLAFLNVFFLTAVIFSQVLLKGETVAVPDLTGKTVAQARVELQKKDLSVAQRGSEFNDRLERGLIIRQEPAPDSRVRVAAVVQVVISAGSEKVRVPNLVNKSLDAVLTLLQGGGLYKGKLSQVHTSRYPAGRVISQRPAPDEVVERNTQVGLLLGQGDVEDRFIMPDLLTGLNADRVIAKLKALGFRVSDIRYVYYQGQPSGVVVGQAPLGGYPVHKRSRISLEVSR